MSVLDTLAHAYERGIVDTGKQPELLLLVSFLLAFGFIRTSAHMIRAQVRWWPGNVDVRGVHIHHLVWGILLMMVLGYVAIALAPMSPWREMLAVGFGVGMGLALDEFALWLDLQDVYWQPRGRTSINAVIVAAAMGGLVLLGVRVWVELAEGTAAVVKLIVAGSALTGVVLAVVNALRGRYVAAGLSLIVPMLGLALWALLRPRPGSIWADVWSRRVAPRLGADRR
jgi:hypothetical protein